MKEYETDFSELMGDLNAQQPQVQQPQPQAQQPQVQQPQPQAQQPYRPYAPYQAYQPYTPYQPYSSGQQPYQSAPYYTGAESKPPKQKKKTSKTWLAILACSLAAAALATSVTSFLTANTLNAQWQAKYDTLVDAFDIKLEQMDQKIEDSSYTGGGNSVSGSQNSSSAGLTPGQVYAQCVSSVVAISNQSVTTNIYGQTSQTASSGSGFILSEDGYVVTNSHVVDGATKLTVITQDGKEYNAILIGQDASNDLAVLKVEATGLKAAKIGSSNKLIVGDQVVAIGNPLGELTNTLTVGYVSAKERSVTTEGSVINMLQTDAAINPGNSGGPLFNMNGEVVGITTAKFSGTTTSGATIEGVGFAIPIDDVAQKIDNLIDYGFVSPAYLGVTVTDVSAEVADAYGIPMGARIREADPQYAAYKGGIRANDIITAVGGHAVTNVNTLTQALLHYQPGDTVMVKVWRGGSVLDLQVTLDRNPGITD